MDATSYLLGLDIGGSAVKVGLFGLRGELSALHTSSISVSTPQSGWAEVEAGQWWQATVVGIQSVLKQSGVSAHQILALGLSNMIGTVTLLDALGRPLRPAIVYYDTRSVAEAAWMVERAPEIPAVTGNRVLAGNTSLAAVFWLREHEPEVFTHMTTCATVNTVLFRWLTGKTRVDWTNASFMGLYDYRQRVWSQELADKLGVDLHTLAEIGSPGDTAPLSPSAAAQLNLLAGTPVVLGGLDGAMSSLGVGAIHVGDAFDVSGTSEMIAVCLPKPVTCLELLGRWHVVPDLWTMIGAISTAGAAWQWFRDELFAPHSQAEAQARYAAMSAEAATAPPGANGVTFLPHMMGERAPLWDAQARGVFFGLTLGSRRADLLRAVLEGTGYAMRHLLEIITERSGIAVQRVVCVGGAARNALWQQIKADIWGLELQVSPVREASSLGAALNAGVAVGVYRDYADAVQRAVPGSGEVIHPNLAQHAAYEHPYRVYRCLYPALAATLHFAFSPPTG